LVASARWDCRDARERTAARARWATTDSPVDRAPTVDPATSAATAKTDHLVCAHARLGNVAGFPGTIGALGDKGPAGKDGIDGFIGVDGVTGVDGGYCRICPDRNTGTVPQ